MSAALARVSRGLSMCEAQDALDTMVEQGDVIVILPTIEDRQALAGELAQCGIAGDVHLQKVQSCRDVLLRLPEKS